MAQEEATISPRLEALYRRAAAAIGIVERQYGASHEEATEAEADFLRCLMDAEAMADRELLDPPRRRLKNGLVQVYTGNGKGKTTAAFGLAARAIGAGLRVCVVQFLKGGAPSGEVELANYFNRLKIIRTASVYDPNVNQAECEALRAETRAGFGKARLLALGGDYDVLILDEINMALFYKFVSVDEMLELIRSKPENLELVLTGRYAPQEIMEAADLVTVMEESKHPASQGVNARRGIDF